MNRDSDSRILPPVILRLSVFQAYCVTRPYAYSTDSGQFEIVALSVLSNTFNPLALALALRCGLASELTHDSCPQAYREQARVPGCLESLPIL